MRPNVPRLGPDGGFVHAESGSLECSRADLEANGAFERFMTAKGCQAPFPYSAFQIFLGGYRAAESYGHVELAALERLVEAERHGASLPPDPVPAIGLILFSRNERILELERELPGKTP